MPYKDLREFINRLEKEGELIRIKEELDPKFEVAAVLKEIGKKDSPAVLFERVRGYDIPVVGNLWGSKKLVALELETSEDAFLDEYQKRQRRRIPPVIVKEAPAKEVIIKQDIAVLKTMPVLTHHERDAGPYITQGMVFAKDPETGRKSMGLHRLQVKGKAKLGVWISEYSPGSGRALKNAESRGQPLEVAIAIGIDPAIILAAYTVTPGVVDKFEVAGGLRGEPLELVKCETLDLEVPANAMFVIEGKIPPWVRELDGPFGDEFGYYIPVYATVIEITAITHQRSPIYPTHVPFTQAPWNSFLTWTVAPQTKEFLRLLIPSLKDVDVSLMAGRYVLSIDKRNEWDARHALYLVLNLVPYAKYAIVVDGDVDVHNREEVDWAVFGRCQPDPDKDLILVTDVLGGELAPYIKEVPITTKIGLDATKPLDRPERFDRIAVPKEATEKAVGIVKKYLG